VCPCLRVVLRTICCDTRRLGLPWLCCTTAACFFSKFIDQVFHHAFASALCLSVCLSVLCPYALPCHVLCAVLLCLTRRFYNALFGLLERIQVFLCQCTFVFGMAFKQQRLLLTVCSTIITAVCDSQVSLPPVLPPGDKWCAASLPPVCRQLSTNR
jgi:hypothetical protein